MNDPRATLPASHQGNHNGTHPAPHAPHAHGQHAPHAPAVSPAHQQTRIPIMPLKVDEEESSPIELIPDAEDEAQVGPSKKIRAFGIGGVAQKDYKRPTYANHTGAVRVKSFHGKLSDQGMDYLDNAINDWLEAHPEHEIKFVTSSVGLFDGKIKEPALILNVWY